MGKTRLGFGRSEKKPAHRESIYHRSKYIDHSLGFLDWVNGLGFEKTWFGRVLHRIDQVFRLRGIAFLFLFSVLLGFLLYLDFDFSYSLRSGEVAPRDVKSPISFEFVDEVATEEKRLAAQALVPLIFDFDRYAFEDSINRVSLAFRKMREEARRVSWAKDEFELEDQVREFGKNKPTFESSLGRKISDRNFEWLVLQKFSPRVENILVETLEVWSQLKVIDGYDRQIPLGLKDLTVHDVSRGGRARSLLLNTRDLHDVSREEDFPVETISGLHTIASKDQRMLLGVARSIVVPNVVLNQKDTELLRKKAREEVMPEILTVKKGQVIVAEGQKVRPLQVGLLKEIERLRSNRNRNLVSLFSAFLFVVLLGVSLSYLRRFTLNRVRVEAKDYAIMGVVSLIVVIIHKMFLFLINAAFVSKYGSLIPESALLFASPVACGTMMVGLLITSGEVVWIFSLFLSVVLSLMVDMRFAFFLVTIAGSLAAARGVYGCKKRNDIYRAGLRTGAVNAAVIALAIAVEHFGDSGFIAQLVWSVPAGMLSGFGASLIAMMLIPALETIFNSTTDVKLLELSNLNHPLLKDMIVRAPGTYHHSLVVGSMVEAAAEEIGANSLLGKVMSYYHDIGKTEHSAYFIENQKPGQNPHDHLSPHMSKTILIAHVKDGVELGLEHKLGKPIIDGIVQHHGTTLISFFYNRAVEKHDEELESVSEEDFRYPGPKPQFREAALIMLADSIEAAARSLDEPTPVRLQNIVKNIIQRKFMDGQLDECNLTLKDLTIIEAAFIRVLLGIYHQRIDYPKKAGGGASETAKSFGKVAVKKGSANA